MEEIKNKIRQYWHILMMLLTGLVIGLTICLFFLFKSLKEKEAEPEEDLIEELMIEDSEEILPEENENTTEEEPIQKSSKEIIVDIKGQVKNPGVYRMEEGNRIIDVIDRKSTRLNSSHVAISYAVFCLKKEKHNIILRSRSGRERSVRQSNDRAA